MSYRFALVTSVLGIVVLGWTAPHYHSHVRTSGGTSSHLPGGVRTGRVGGDQPVGMLSALDIYKKPKTKSHQSPLDFLNALDNGPIGLALEYKQTKSVRIHSTIDKSRLLQQQQDEEPGQSAKNFVDTMTGPNSNLPEIPHDIWWSSGTFDGWYSKTIYSTRNQNELQRKLAGEEALQRYSQAQNFGLQGQLPFVSPYQYGTTSDSNNPLNPQGNNASATSSNPKDIFGYSRVNPFSSSKGRVDPYASVRSGFFSSKPTRH